MDLENSVFAKHLPNAQGITFFPEKEIEIHSKNFSRLLYGYTQYFYESMWLLTQKFFIRLCLAHKFITLDEMEKALQIQYKSFYRGKQIHIGEIFLQRTLLEVEQVHLLLQKLGNKLWRCKVCKQKFFNILPVLQGLEGICSLCNAPLKEIAPDKTLLLQALRTHLFRPRPFSHVTLDAPHSFLSLDIVEYFNMDLQQLDYGIRTIFLAFHQWIQDILHKEGFSSGEGHASKSDDEISNNFYGYARNLSELFWLMNQKIFALKCFSSRSLTHTQLEKGLRLQQRALRNGRQIHLGEALMRIFQLDEEQVYTILKETGNRILFCQLCMQFSFQPFSTYTSPVCPKCGSPLEEITPQRERLVQSLHINFAGPIPLYTADVPEFSFFAKRLDYTPDFSLSAKEIHRAIESLHLSIRGKNDDPSGDSYSPKTSEDPAVSEIYTEEFSEFLNMEEDRSSFEDLLSSRHDESSVFLNIESLQSAVEKKVEENSTGSRSLSHDFRNFLESIGGADVKHSPDEEIYESFFTKISPGEKYEENLESLAQSSLHTLSGEFSAFLKSIDVKDGVADEDLYESYFGKISRYGKILSNIVKKPTKHIPKKLEIYAPQFSENSKEKFYTLTDQIILLVFMVAIGGLLYLIPLFFTKEDASQENIKNKVVASSSSKKKSSAFSKSIDIEDPNFTTKTSSSVSQARSSSSVAASVTSSQQNQNKEESALKKFLSTEPQVWKIEQALIRFINQGSLKTSDLSLLENLYEQYISNRGLRLAVIQCVEKIGVPRSYKWLGEVLLNTTEIIDRIVIIDAFKNSGYSKAAENISLTFQRETDPGVQIAAANALSILAAESDEVQKIIIAKFYEVSDARQKLNFIKAVTAMRVKSQTSFFMQVVLNRGEHTAIRVAALDALKSDGAGNAAKHVSELSLIANAERGFLRHKIKEVVQALSKKK